MAKAVQGSTFTFRNLIEGKFVYVDKTQYLYNLVQPGSGVYFLSRPRRFGKSLMLSTLEEIFLGNRALFKGLWIDESDYDWQTYPVVRIDFSLEQVSSATALQDFLGSIVEATAKRYGVKLTETNYQRKFRQLLELLSEEQKVVILIDEYDKPMIDNLDNLPEALRIRDTLRGFYAVIKGMDRYLRFVFITGISKFSKVGVFSAMNNLTDLTMNPRFATALGITEEEMADYFHEHIAEFAAHEGMTSEQLAAKIRHWYNGFCFVEDSPAVYNPFSTLQLFYHQRFATYWFESGTPYFLIKLIKERNYEIEPLEQLEVPEISFSTYELESLELTPLLFQTGYLTIKGFQRDRFGEIYTLSYPNYEVKNSFLTYLLRAYDSVDFTMSESHLRRLLFSLEKQDLPQFFNVLAVFFANVDYSLYIDHEKYYQTIFYLIFKLIGLRIDAEVHTNAGRIDCVIDLAERTFLFEFKLNKSAAEALQQIKDHDYARKYRLAGKPITLIGANFDTQTRTVIEWLAEEA